MCYEVLKQNHNFPGYRPMPPTLFRSNGLLPRSVNSLELCGVVDGACIVGYAGAKGKANGGHTDVKINFGEKMRRVTSTCYLLYIINIGIAAKPHFLLSWDGAKEGACHRVPLRPLGAAKRCPWVQKEVESEPLGCQRTPNRPRMPPKMLSTRFVTKAHGFVTKAHGFVTKAHAHGSQKCRDWNPLLGQRALN